MAGIGGVVVQFKADASKAIRETQKLARSLKDVDKNASTASKGMDGLGKVAKFGIAAAGAGVAAAGVGIAALGTKMVMLAADFEESQNILQAALGATAVEMTQLSDLAKKMGKDTIFSAQDASQAMTELAKAGLSVSDIMGGGVQAAMALAATEGLDLAEAATATSNAMNAFGISAADLPSVADALAGAAKSSTASVSSLMQGLQQVGAGAKTAGLSLQETVAVLAAFDNIGIKGSDAGTSLKTMLTKLIPQTKKSQDAFVKYNLSVYRSKLALKALRDIGLKPASGSIEDVTDSLKGWYKQMGYNSAQQAKAAEEFLWVEAYENQLVNANGSMKDATQIADVLAGAMGGLSESAKIEAGNLLFGSDAARAASALADLGSKGLKPFIEGAEDVGVAAEQADARTKGLKGKLEALGGAAETIGIQIGEKLLPVLTGWITEFTDFLDTPRGAAMIEGLAGKVQTAAEAVAGWVDGTLVPAIGRVYTYFASPDGQQAIQDWTDKIQAAADAVGALIGWMAKFPAAYDKLPGWFKTLQGKAFELIGNMSLPGVIDRIAGDDPVTQTPTSAPKGKTPAAYYDPRAGGVVVNIQYPTPKSAEDSAAEALRIAANIRRVRGG